VLECFEGEPYCPACTRYAPAPEPAPVWFNASTTGGQFVHGDRDLEVLIAWVRDVVCDQDDVIISAGPRVVAIVCSEGRVVRIR
jgi:hypothetical protein